MQYDRVLPIAGTYNVRDLGGYAAGEAQTGWRRLLRAESLHRMDEAGQAALKATGLSTVIDLRHDEELARNPNPLRDEPGLEYINIPLFAGLDTQKASGDDKLYSLYCAALEECQPAIAAVMNAIIDAGDGAVLFHCTAGKDRTGVIAALLLSLGGVAPDVVAEDYAMTRPLLEPIIPELEAAAAEQGGDPAVTAALLGSNPATMLGFLDHLNATYGGAEAYLRSIGLDQVAIERLRARILQETSA